jgi:hypothetical protein
MSRILGQLFTHPDVLLISIDETHIRSDRNGKQYQWQFVSNDRPFKYALLHNPEAFSRDIEEGKEQQSLGEITSEISSYTHRQGSKKSRSTSQSVRGRGRPKKP